MEKRFTPEVEERLRAEIRDAKGSEVLFVGKIDPRTRVVHEISVAARGNRDTVPALYPHMEQGDTVIHNHPSGVLLPSGPDLAVASQLGNQGIGFWIINNAVSDCYAVSEPVVINQKERLAIEEAASHLEPGGSFSKIIANYESRESQVGLLRLFAQGFNEDTVVAAEAGTGVGKSFAYLVPSFLWAARNKERVVVSTATINLQQQLLEKDIPLVQRALGTSLKVVLVKGRRNYLCPNRLAEELRESTEPGQSAEQLRLIGEWSQATKTGDLAELGFIPEDGLWGRVCSDGDSCHGMRCQQKEGCFFAKARKEASGASILVVNHHLLFADLALRMNGFGFDATAVLPAFHRIVFDEAHNLEKNATSYFSEAFSRPFLFKLLGRLYRKRRRGGYGGIVVSLQGLGTEKIDFNRFPVLVLQLQKSTESFNQKALDVLAGASSLRVSGDSGHAILESLLSSMLDIQKPLLDLVDLCDNLAELWEDEDDVPAEVYEIKSIARKLEGLSQVIDRYKSFEKDPESVFWVEKQRDFLGNFYVELVISPLNIDRLMNKAVFQPYRTVVMTSATLTIREKWGFWASRIGLNLVDQARLLKGIFPSPFDYKSRVLLGSPPDFPLPDDPRYQESLEAYLPQIIKASGGSALVLFTSYESMKHAYHFAKPALAELGIAVYKQGDEERGRLMDRFKREVTSVLFATDSFWEGVDSPGDTLRLVIICRLPFRVPSDPIIAARMEDLQRQGKDPFVHYSLPEAVTKFKQGFGRLMRHTDDSGGIIVLDTRILKKHYGAVFLGALPETQQAFLPMSQLPETLTSFLRQSSG